MSRKTIVLLSVIGGLVLLLFVMFSNARKTYDNAVDLQTIVDQKWNDVSSAYQRRADLVPQLMNTVKGAAANEKEILTQVTQARSGVVNAKTPEEMEMFGKKINTAINLMYEAYPQIRSTEAFLTFQSQLEGTENRINVARDRYNEAVQGYDSYIRKFWQKIYLGILGDSDEFPKKEGFKAKEGSENAPTVDFSK